MGTPVCSEYEKRWSRFARTVGTSWRVDETYVSIRGRWHYLYRAVDTHGKTIDLLLRRDRGIAASLAFFRKTLATVAPRVPRKVTLDGHVPSRRASWLLRREQRCWRNVEVRTSRYLNNVIATANRAHSGNRSPKHEADGDQQEDRQEKVAGYLGCFHSKNSLPIPLRIPAIAHDATTLNGCSARA